MAIVPNEAVRRFHELTPKAALLYVYYCYRRNDDSEIAWPSLARIASDMHIPKSSACELRSKLVEKGWIEIVSGDTVRLITGYESEENPKTGQNPPTQNQHLAFGKVERRSEKSNASDSEKSNDVRKSRTERSEKSNGAFGKVELHIRNNSSMELHHGTTEGVCSENGITPPSSAEVDEIALAVSDVTGIRPSGRRLESELRVAALGLHGQGFTAAEVRSVAKQTGRTYKLDFCVKDLTQDRARIRAPVAVAVNSRAARREQAKEQARQKLFGGSNGRE